MSAWIVYSKDGQTERCKLKKLEYSGSFMNERTVTATFEYHSEVAFEVFDYIVYRGEKFELEAIPSVKKISSMDYQYELRFVSLKYELERCEMRDIVPNDNGITYPTPLTFSFTGDVRYLAERIQANLDALYGQGVWAIVVSDDVESEEKNITIAQQNCWNALSLVNTTYGLNFSIKGRVVTVGGNQPTVGHTFQYGKGNGLYEIERNSDTDTGIVTKLRAYGSTRNLDYSYPKKPEWTDSVLPVSFILSPLRLMLPSFKEDGKTDYILANEATISEYGIREASVIYDDIYPSITGATNSSGVPIDEIKSVEPIDDSASTFVVYLHDLEFDLESQLMTDNAQISMKSGAMQGYTFNISEIEKQSDNSYRITLGRITTDESDTGNFDIPNSSWNMAAGDKFVFLNILMPQKYIRDAEERLLKRAQEYLAEYGKTNFSYNVGLHDKFLKEHEAVYNELIEGAKLSVYDSELGISENVTVQSITITEYADDNILPQVKVTLNNKPSASTLERIQGQIKELSETSAGQFSTQSELLKQYRRKLDKPFFDRLFAAVDFDGNEIPSTDMTTPIAYIKARTNFASLGGVTMYLDDKSLNLPSIYDGLPIDHDTIYWEYVDGFMVLKAKGGGSVDEGAVKEIIESYDYATKDFVRDYVLQNATGGEFELSKQMVIEALGFTPYSAENPNGYITAASIPSALKNPYALTFGSKTYDGSSAKSITASDLGAALSSDLSKYLPLSGGTLTDILTIKSGGGYGLKIQSTNNDIPSIVFSGTSGSLGRIFINGLNGSFYRTNNDFSAMYKIWDENNDGSGSGLDADTLDGVHASKLYQVNRAVDLGGTTADYDTLIVRYSNTSATSNHPYSIVGGNQCVALNLYAGTNHAAQIAVGFGTNYLAYRRKVGSTSWQSWVKINAGLADEATKLQTARTIWGQSFDGTGDVTGTLKIPNDYTLRWFDNAGGDINGMYLSSKNEFFIGNGAAAKGYNTYLSGKDIIFSYGTSRKEGVRINSSGNVGIGTITPSAKLHVNGTALIGNNVAGGELLRFNMDRPWVFIQEDSGANSKLVLKPLQDTKYFIVKNANNEKLLLCYAVNGGNIVEVGGNIRLDNGKGYYAKDTEGNNISLVGFNSSNQLSIGYGLNSKGYIMGLGGKIVNFYYGTERTLGMVLNDSGNVGIGTTSPKSRLHIVGNIFLTGYHGGAALYAGLRSDEALSIEIIDTNGNWVGKGITLLNNGYVGIGTQSPSAKLHVEGNILATGGVTMQSQRSLKNVVDERGLSLAELSAITPTRFTWIDKRDEKIHFGGIADDIERVLPEVIYKTEDGTLTMDYGNAGFAIASSLIKPVVDHEERIKALEKENEELKKRLNRYEA